MQLKDKKEFSSIVSKLNIETFIKAIYYRLFDGEDAIETLWTMILKNLNGAKNFEKLLPLANNIRISDYGENREEQIAQAKYSDWKNKSSKPKTDKSENHHIESEVINNDNTITNNKTTINQESI